MNNLNEYGLTADEMLDALRRMRGYTAEAMSQRKRDYQWRLLNDVWFRQVVDGMLRSNLDEEDLHAAAVIVGAHRKVQH